MKITSDDIVKLEAAFAREVDLIDLSSESRKAVGKAFSRVVIDFAVERLESSASLLGALALVDKEGFEG